MTFSLRLVRSDLAPSLVLLSALAIGCGGAVGPAPQPSSGAVVKPPSVTPEAPAIDPAASARTCSAVVNITLPQKADLLFGERHVAVLVDLDHPDAEPKVASSILARGPEGLSRLQKISHVVANGPFHDATWCEWVTVAPGGSVGRVVAKGNFGELPKWRKEDGPVQHHTHLDLSATSVIGPYFSYQRQIYELRENGVMDKPFAGGFYARDLTTGQLLVAPQALLKEVVAAVNADIEELNGAARARGKPMYASMDVDEDGRAMFAFAFGAPGTGPIEGPPPELSALALIWPDPPTGDGPMKRAIELFQPPGELSKVLVFDDEAGLVRAPNGCGSVGVRDGMLVRRKGKGPVEKAFRGHVDRLVGVTWLADGEAESVPQIPTLKPRADDRATLAHRLYASGEWEKARDAMREAVRLEPDSPLWMRDLARLLDHYTGKDADDQVNLAEANTLLQRALPLAQSPEMRASIHFRMGEITRRLGDKASAKRLFEASFADAATDPAKSAASN